MIMRTKIIWSAAAMLVGIIGGVTSNYFHSFQDTAITISPGISTSILRDTGKGELGYDPKAKPLFSLSGSQTIRLSPGTYDAVIDNPSQQYRNPVTKFTVSNQPQRVSIDPSFTDQKLATMLSQEQPAVLQVFQQKYPTYKTHYSLIKGRLLHRGDWYGALLAPNTPQLDVLRVILQKKGNTWTIETDPPEISIGKPSHPNIPIEVIESVDSL